MQGRYLRRTKQTEQTQTSMPRLGFEATIPLLERAMFHAATVIGRFQFSYCLFVYLKVIHPFQAEVSEHAQI
jgi:hypothetical protein